MIKNDDNYLLFIEPKNKPKNTIDNLTHYFAKQFLYMQGKDDFTKGFHICSCGEYSDNVTYDIDICGKTYITNVLALHYVQYHREEIPTRDLDIINQLILNH